MSQKKNVCCHCCSDIAADATICKDCKRVQRWYAKCDMQATFGVIKALLVPITLLGVGAYLQNATGKRATDLQLYDKLAADIDAAVAVAVEFQRAKQKLTSGCSDKDDIPACLEEYQSHLGAFDALVAQVSWKSSTMLMSDRTYALEHTWKDQYWDTVRPAIAGLLSVQAKRVDGTSLKACQADYTASVCAKELLAGVKGFDEMTQRLFCAFVVDIDELRTQIYQHLGGTFSRLLLDRQVKHRARSSCRGEDSAKAVAR